MTITNTKQPKIKPEKRPAQKIPRRITETYLHNSGLYYLQRYATSSANFRTVMLRKVKRSCQHHQDQNYEDCAGLVEALILKFEASGLLNDQMYLEGAIRSFRRKGLSKRAIFKKLSQKGLNEDQILPVLSAHDEDLINIPYSDHNTDHQAEITAAAIFCRRKRLGAFNPAPRDNNDPERDNDHQKQMAKLARAGFGFDVVRKVLAKSREELEELAR